MRLRAWKLGRAVFDLTRIDGALWVWSLDQEEAGAQPQTRSVPSGEQLSAGWRLISGRLFASPADRVLSGDSLVAVYQLGPDDSATALPTAWMTIDRRTQTVSRIVINDSEGQARTTYEPSHYRLIDGVPWPTRVRLSLDALSLTLILDEVELNGELPGGAFTPPRDARKQP